MSPVGQLRDAYGWAKLNWRITLLVVFVSVSLLVLFFPFELVGGAGPVEEAEGITNLQWGIDLGGGASVRAPIAGYIAEDVPLDPEETAALESDIAAELNVSTAEIHVHVDDPQNQRGSVETTAPAVEREAFLEAMQAAGVDVSDGDIRSGVHEETRNTVVRVLNDRVDVAGLSGSRVVTATQPGGEHFVIVEVPGQPLSEVQALIQERGVVEVVAHFPDGDGYRNETVLDFDDFDRVDPANPGEGNRPPNVPVRITEEAAPGYVNDLNEYGFTEEGIENCRWEDADDRPDDPGYCLLTKVDGNVTYAAGITSGLAEDIRTNNFLDSRIFLMQTGTFEEAQQLEINLNAGGLPAELAFERGTNFELEAWLGAEFRVRSLVVGLFAALAVAGMVYWRYRDARIAAPMLLTASAEVVILLAFAISVNMSLGLAEVAGLIAVLGTGVDDLVIIADEIMQRGEIRTNRIFDSRFRKAFWVIGVAAATTILAMTPLVGMSLGDLMGFAIVTIAGVIIGVTITRPAYGNILRVLMLD